MIYATTISPNLNSNKAYIKFAVTLIPTITKSIDFNIALKSLSYAILIFSNISSFPILLGTTFNSSQGEKVIILFLLLNSSTS